MKITTEICKAFLISKYPQTKQSDWKRLKKYKDGKGVWIRDFGCDSLDKKVIIKEDPNQAMGLSVVMSSKLSRAEREENFMNEPAPVLKEKMPVPHISLPVAPGVPILPRHIASVMGNMANMYNPSNNQTVQVQPSSATTPEEIFLETVEIGINWDKADKDRSTFDLLQKTTVQNIISVAQTKDNNYDLLNSYVGYMNGQLNFFWDLDETYVPHHLTTPDFDDSLPDMMHVLGQIMNHYQQNNLPVTAGIIPQFYEVITTLRGMMDGDEDMLEQANQNLDELVSTLEKLSGKKNKPKP